MPFLWMTWTNEDYIPAVGASDDSVANQAVAFFFKIWNYRKFVHQWYGMVWYVWWLT